MINNKIALKGASILLICVAMILSTVTMTANAMNMGALNGYETWEGGPIIISGSFYTDGVLHPAVRSGTGASNEPFVIENWYMGDVVGSEIKIRDIEDEYFEIKDCHIDGEPAKDSSIDFVDVKHGTIENCYLTNEISFCGSSFNTITGCKFGVLSPLRATGISLRDSSDNNEISGCELIAQRGYFSADGIKIYMSRDNKIHDCVISNFGSAGISMSASSWPVDNDDESYWNEVYSNVITECDTGIYLSGKGTYGNNFYDNYIFYNYRWYVGFEGEVTIENHHIYDAGSNAWGPGNYWGDYDGSGVYTLGSGNIDSNPKYPLDIEVPPKKPMKYSILESGKTNKEFTCKYISSDLNGDEITFTFDWGDGTSEESYGPYPTDGESVIKQEFKHTWTEEGSYNIKVKARDSTGKESVWSDPVSISMSKDQAKSTPLLKFFKGYQALLQLLQQFLQNLPAIQ